MIRSASIARRLRLPACSGALVVLLAVAAWAQVARRGENRFVADRLYRIPNGFFGIAPLSDGGALTRYNDTLAGAASIVLGDIVPIDFAMQEGSDDRGLLLAAQLGRAGLYGIRLATTPEIVPVWESTLPPMRRIVAIGDFDRDGSIEAALVGDSAFSVVGIDGEERFTQRGEMIEALVHRGDSTRFIVARRSNDGVVISLIDPRDGAIRATQVLPGGREIVMALMETAAGEALAVASLGERATAFIFDPATLAPPDRIPLPHFPLALIPYRNGRGLLPTALFGTYPAPMAMPLTDGEPERITIDYPFAGVVAGVSTVGDYIVLAARDSIALYDRRLDLLAVLPSVGTADMVIAVVDSTRLLISSAAGSRVVALPASEISWLDRNWPLVALGVAGIILIAAAFAASRRYRFIRTLYNNLVRVPSSHGVIVTSPRHRVRHINQSAREMLEIASYIPLGRHITEYLVAEELRTVLPPLRRLFSDGIEFVERIDASREGEVRSFTFRGRPLIGRYGTTAGYLLLVEDVTQTLERERLVNWASVAHHIAHEMKTPLSTVAMTAEMLLDRMNGNGIDGEYARATSRIVKQSARLREIVEDLLTVARTESLQKVSTDLALLISSLAHDFTDYLPKNVELRLEIGPGNFRCSADVSQLLVAFRNLLENAAQAIGTRQGGLIRLQIQEMSDEIMITIEDNGVGMSKETLAKLFQPFYTERQGGSGIGTVIIKRVIEGHGGTIRVESERGKGTKFVIVLPKGH